VEIALNMLRKSLVSVEMASRLAGMNLPDFINYLRRRGVKPYSAEDSEIEL